MPGTRAQCEGADSRGLKASVRRSLLSAVLSSRREIAFAARHVSRLCYDAGGGYCIREQFEVIDEIGVPRPLNDLLRQFREHEHLTVTIED